MARKITNHTSRAYGSGAFKERRRSRKDGTVAITWEGYVYASDRKKVYGSGTTARSAEVSALNNQKNYERNLVQAAHKIIDAEKAKKNSLSLYEAMDRYIGRKAYSFNTERKYRGFANVILNPQYFSRTVGSSEVPIGRAHISDLSVEDLEDFIREYRSYWTENSTYNLQIFVRQVFKHAIKRKWIVDNPAIALESRHKTMKVRLPIPDHLMHRLVDLCDHPQLKAFLLLCTYALRAGEAAALTKRAIVAPNTVHVMYTQAWMKNDLRGSSEKAPRSTLGLSEPKTANAFRLIEIESSDWWIIEQSLETAIDDSVLTYDLGRRDEQFLFPNSRGGQWRTDHIRLALKKFLRGVSDEQVNRSGANLPHTWRVSVITNLLDGDEEEGGDPGLSLPVVSRFAGHGRSEITANIYYKSSKKAQLATSRRVGKIRRRHSPARGADA